MFRKRQPLAEWPPRFPERVPRDPVLRWMTPRRRNPPLWLAALAVILFTALACAAVVALASPERWP